MMVRIIEYLQGKKTYISTVSGVLVSLAAVAEMIVPQLAVWLLAINGFLTAAFLRAGVEKAAEAKR